MSSEFGPYRVLRSLGKGGFGEVYEVVHGGTGAHYALKTIPPFADPEDAQRFAREAEAMARLDHPNVARIFSADLSGGRPYLVQELLTGGDLARRIQAGPLPLEEALRITEQLAQGLAAVHAEGILHRDIKPENVLLDAAGVPKLVDFGLARLEDRTRLTETHSLLGTPAYMAPEQARGIGVDPRSDLYSLTALLYALLIGQPPFTGRPTLLALLNAVVQEPPPRPSATRPDLPPSVDGFVARGLAKEPQERHQDASEFAAALGGAPAPPSSLPALILMSLGLLLFVLIAVGAALALALGDEPRPQVAPSARVTPSQAPSPEASPSVPAPRSEVVLRRWSRVSTSAFLFDSQSLIALDARGRAERFSLADGSHSQLFQLQGSQGDPNPGEPFYSYLAPEGDSWIVGVATWPLYRGDLTKPLTKVQLQRTVALWRGDLYYSTDKSKHTLYRLGDPVDAFPIPSAPGEESLTVEALAPAPDGEGLLILSERRLMTWTPTRLVEHELPRSQSKFSTLAVSPNGERVYAASREGVVLSAAFGPSGEVGSWRRFQSPLSEAWKQTAHTGSVKAVVVTGTGVYTLAYYGRSVELKAWDPRTDKARGTMSFEHPGGVANLAIDPSGRQLAIGLTSGGVRLVAVGDLLRSD